MSPVVVIGFEQILFTVEEGVLQEVCVSVTEPAPQLSLGTFSIITVIRTVSDTASMCVYM